VIRRAYSAFAARDLVALRELAVPEIEIRTVTGMLAHRDEPYRGYAGIEQYLRDVAEVWGELELVPAEFHDLTGGRVLVLGRVRARRGSTLIDSASAWLWEVHDDLIVSAQVFGDPETAMALLDGAEQEERGDA